MNDKDIGLRVGGVIFGLVCLAQVLRLATRAEVLVAGHAIPLWPNAVAAVVAAALSVWMFKLAGSRRE